MTDEKMKRLYEIEASLKKRATIGTHWADCHKSHPDCASRWLASELREAWKELSAIRQSLIDEMIASLHSSDWPERGETIKWVESFRQPTAVDPQKSGGDVK